TGLKVRPIVIRVPLPPPHQRQHSTVLIEIEPRHLTVPQIEYCLVALDEITVRMIQTDIIPTEAYPIRVAPQQAAGAYVEISKGPVEDALTWPTLLLAVRGVFEGMLSPRPLPRQATFEIDLPEDNVQIRLASAFSRVFDGSIWFLSNQAYVQREEEQT
ncbi:MAG: hypothetical protein Q9210_005054, partial [Variospora velana]